MTYQKIIDELHTQLDSAAREQHMRKQKLEAFLGQFKIEEQKLRKKLKKASSGSMRLKLKKELGLVETGYKLLGSNLRLRHA